MSFAFHGETVATNSSVSPISRDITDSSKYTSVTDIYVLSVFEPVLLVVSFDDVPALSQEDNTNIITSDKTRQMSNVIFPFVLVILDPP